jgi:hypothetical protein
LAASTALANWGVNDGKEARISDESLRLPEDS